METVSRATGFFEARIKLKEVKKTRYSREFDYFAFEYDGEDYILGGERKAVKRGNKYGSEISTAHGSCY